MSPRHLFAAAALFALLAAPADAAPRKAQRVTLSVDAGAAQQLTVCGESRSVHVVGEGAEARAATQLVDRRGLRAGGRHARLVVERCVDGKWERVSDERFGTVGKYRRVRSYRLPLGTAAHGDYRVEAVARRDRRRRAARSGPQYLRVGVGEIVDRPLSFEVENVNRTRVPCSSDGKRYTVRGHLQGPRSALAGDAPTATLYLHGVEISDAYFRYRGRVPGYDFMTEMAEVGHVSVSIDRLGHGESDKPEGSGICVGSQADMAHQVVDQLRAGGSDRPAFKKVALAGHSFGSFTAEIAQMSFKNADVLVGMAFAAEGINGPLIAENTVGGEQGSCNQGGMEKAASGPLGYAFLWMSTDRWAADTYDNVDPKVVEDARAFRERSPCGELNSAVPTGVVEPLGYRDITVPVLLLFGKQDDVFPSPAGERHRLLFTGSPEVTFHEIDPAGHTLMLQRSAPEFRAKLSEWLKRQGF